MKNIKKIKHIAIGLIIGLCLNNIIVYADDIKEFVLYKADYPIMINDVEYSNEESPILNYNGTTYVPLTEFANSMDISVKWNVELNRLEILDNSNSDITTTEIQESGDVLDISNEEIIWDKELEEIGYNCARTFATKSMFLANIFDYYNISNAENQKLIYQGITNLNDYMTREEFCHILYNLYINEYIEETNENIECKILDFDGVDDKYKESVKILISKKIINSCRYLMPKKTVSQKVVWDTIKMILSR